jgi:CRISPR-associated protein Cas2
VQNSVFEGNLEKSQYFDLRYQLKNYLRVNIDSCIVFKSNNENWLTKEFLIEQEDKTTNML